MKNDMKGECQSLCFHSLCACRSLYVKDGVLNAWLLYIAAPDGVALVILISSQPRLMYSLLISPTSAG